MQLLDDATIPILNLPVLLLALEMCKASLFAPIVVLLKVAYPLLLALILNFHLDMFLC